MSLPNSLTAIQSSFFPYNTGKIAMFDQHQDENEPERPGQQNQHQHQQQNHHQPPPVGETGPWVREKRYIPFYLKGGMGWDGQKCSVNDMSMHASALIGTFLRYKRSGRKQEERPTCTCVHLLWHFLELLKPIVITRTPALTPYTQEFRI